MKLIQKIKILVLNIDEGDDTIQFQIDLTNGICSTSLDFYAYADEFKEFAAGLISFPKTINDTVIYELGEDVERCAYYMLFKVYCYEVNGYSAIQIKVNNHSTPPYSNKTEFYITTVPASLNKFGHSLNNWNPKNQKEIIWTAD